MASENWASWTATFQSRVAKIEEYIAELNVKKESARDPKKASEYQERIDFLNNAISTTSSRILNKFALHKAKQEGPQQLQAPANIESDEENISPRAKTSLG